MDVKNLKTQVTYRIEPKEGGGFIARATDPAVPSIEAPTREELQEKIRAQALEQIAAEFPMVKRLLEHQLKSGEVVTSKHSSTVVIRSTGNETEVKEFSSPEEGGPFSKELSGLMNKSVSELAQALVAQNDGNSKTATVVQSGMVNAGSQSPKPADHPIANTPIVPEASSRWPLLVLGLSILALLLYFLVNHH